MVEGSVNVTVGSQSNLQNEIMFSELGTFGIFSFF